MKNEMNGSLTLLHSEQLRRVTGVLCNRVKIVISLRNKSDNSIIRAFFDFKAFFIF